MLSQLKQIASLFAEVASCEDDVLFNIAHQGIFFMPELAYAYACGKAVMTERKKIFGIRNVNWLRETDIGGGGPSDLVFDLSTNRVIVEFKMRDKIQSYLADIEKLKRLVSNQNALMFCVLLDPFTKNLPDDGRVKEIVAKAGCKMTQLLEPFHCFPTKQNWYKEEVSCLVAVWAIGDVPELKI